MLQVMQDATITRVGGNTPIKLDVRFVVASNQNLEELVRQGKFREDLFFRINVVTLNVPALKDHKDDIPELCEHFIRQYNLESGKSIESLDPKCYPVLFEYDWPGNIRELKNVITHACIFGAGERLSEAVIRQSIGRHQAVQVTAPALPRGEEGYMGRITKSQLVQLLKKHHGRAARVAAEMGVARNSVYYNIRKFKISLAEFQV
jgi:two-component system response regulator HydG